MIETKKEGNEEGRDGDTDVKTIPVRYLMHFETGNTEQVFFFSIRRTISINFRRRDETILPIRFHKKKTNGLIS